MVSPDQDLRYGPEGLNEQAPVAVGHSLVLGEDRVKIPVRDTEKEGTDERIRNKGGKSQSQSNNRRASPTSQNRHSPGAPLMALRVILSRWRRGKGHGVAGVCVVCTYTNHRDDDDDGESSGSLSIARSLGSGQRKSWLLA